MHRLLIDTGNRRGIARTLGGQNPFNRALQPIIAVGMLWQCIQLVDSLDKAACQNQRHRRRQHRKQQFLSTHRANLPTHATYQSIV